MAFSRLLCRNNVRPGQSGIIYLKCWRQTTNKLPSLFVPRNNVPENLSFQHEKQIKALGQTKSEGVHQHQSYLRNGKGSFTIWKKRMLT